MIKRINLIFAIQLVVVGLVISGLIPRLVVPYLALALAVYFLKAPLEELTIFFVRSIPFFVAIPITANFDPLNAWRILAIIVFLRWLDWGKLKRLVSISYARPVQLSLVLILVLAFLSLTQAQSAVLGIKRIIFIVNMGLIGVVIYDLVRSNPGLSRRLIKNIVVPTVIVALVGMAQLVSTYFLDIFQFMDYWGNVVERNMYGNGWAEIALKANTWFAYFGDKLSLRMFSIFPDSHSFPMFLIFGLPAVLAVALEKIVAQKPLSNYHDRSKMIVSETGSKPDVNLKTMLKSRGRWLVIFVPIIFLAVILSGTRGMWAAGAGSWLLVTGYWWFFKKRGIDQWRQSAFKFVSLHLTIFFVLFGLAYPIFASPQFEVAKEDGGLLAKRVRSIINLGETSNARRLEIWKETLNSIVKRPLLGVGIGNFPVVVGEDLARAKAGSSAHNLYLHIAAEMGIPALLAALSIFWLLLKKTYHNYLAERDPMLLIFFGASLIFIPWNLIYSLTDIAIFDERAFLLFATTIALIFSRN